MLALGHHISDYDFSLLSGLAEEMGTPDSEVVMLESDQRDPYR